MKLFAFAPDDTPIVGTAVLTPGSCRYDSNECMILDGHVMFESHCDGTVHEYDSQRPDTDERGVRWYVDDNGYCIAEDNIVFKDEDGNIIERDVALTRTAIEKGIA